MLLLSSVPVFHWMGCLCFAHGAEPVFLGVWGRGVVLASSLLGQSCEGQNIKHLLALGSEKTSARELLLLLPSSPAPSPFSGSSFIDRQGQ